MSDQAQQLLVFISHASEDSAAAKRLTKRLREDGFDPWLDLERLLPGQDWDLEIGKAMRGSGAILLCFSEASVAKEGYIQKEYKRARAIEEEKPEGTLFLFPVRLDECEIPHFIRDKQWVDYPGGYDKLVTALNLRAGKKNMSKKKEEETASPKGGKKARPDKPASQKTGGTNITVLGSIKVAGNWINGDQHNTITNNYITNNISSPADFVAALNQLRAEIEALKAKPETEPAVRRRLNTVQEDLAEAITEAEGEKPAAGRIRSTLEGAKDTLDRIEGSLGSAMQLGTTLGNLALMVWNIFGR